MRTSRTNAQIGMLLSLAVALGIPGMLVGSQGAHADSYFPQTGYSIWGPFETYWNLNGGLAKFGLPLTSVYHAGEEYDAQGFERALFTYNPNNPNAYRVELNLLGSQVTASRRSEAPFVTAKPGTDGEFFSETGHNL